jgi:hypothetical protein
MEDDFELTLRGRQRSSGREYLLGVVIMENESSSGPVPLPPMTHVKIFKIENYQKVVRYFMLDRGSSCTLNFLLDCVT